MAYQRTLFVKTQIVLGTWDEDGNLVAKEEVPEVRELCHPYGLTLEKYVQEVEGHRLPQREGQRR